MPASQSGSSIPITDGEEAVTSSVHESDEDVTLRMVPERTRSGARILAQDMEALADTEMTDVEAAGSSDYGGDLGLSDFEEEDGAAE